MKYLDRHYLFRIAAYLNYFKREAMNNIRCGSFDAYRQNVYIILKIIFYCSNLLKSELDKLDLNKKQNNKKLLNTKARILN